MIAFELACHGCGWRTVCGRADAIGRLRLVGQLRREREPEDELVAALLVESAPQMTCPVCKEKRLQATPTDADADAADGDWQAATLCEVCREPIPPERLEALPGALRCVACQEKSESADATDESREYCPHCGSLVELRVSGGGGITRYRRFCTGDPPCRL
jgi:Zn finger protein HypA/HybF involved in hydrogenase expression